MAYVRELLDARVDIVVGHAEAEHPKEVRAGTGECKLCECPGFIAVQNQKYCASCRHHTDDHRY